MTCSKLNLKYPMKYEPPTYPVLAQVRYLVEI